MTSIDEIEKRLLVRARQEREAWAYEPKDSPALGLARLLEETAEALARSRRMEEALRKIAAFDDKMACARLESTGSYGALSCMNGPSHSALP